MASLKGSTRGVVRLVVGLVVLLVVVFAVQAAQHFHSEGRASSYFEERAMMAATDTADLGVMPSELVESSGLAVSRAHPGVLWSHNDSGDEPWIYQIDTTANLVGRVRVSDAEAIDWESMDIGPCPAVAEVVPDWCIYAADVGDNETRRDTLTIYVVPEPDPASTETEVTRLARIRYGYSGAHYDVEGVAVAPDGDLVLVTKGRSPDILAFRLEAEAVREAAERDEVIQLTGGVRLPIEPDWDVGRAVTGASISPDGALLVVRTYSEFYFFTWPIGGTATAAAPVCFMGDYEPQGEAVGFWSQGRILVTSESRGGRVGHLLALRCAGVNTRGPY